MEGKAVQGHKREREDSREGESVKTARLQGSGSKRRVEEDSGGASSKRARGDDDAGKIDLHNEAHLEARVAAQRDTEAEVRLRVKDKDSSKEKEVVARVCVEKVDLSSHSGLVALPEELKGFGERVRDLRAGGNRLCENHNLKELPEWLAELTGLQTLDLEKCSGLKALPQAVGGLTGLTGLDLGGCEGLEELPAGIGGLTGLQTLNLGWCEGLRELPAGIGGLTGLQTLNLRWCSGLRELPAGIGGLTGLQTLDLRWCSGLRELPAGIGGLTGLQTLNLGGCSGLKALPEAVGGLTGLQTLDLGCSGLKELPAGMEVLTGLQTLDLGGCSGLEELPAGIGGLTGLQTLNLRGCSGLKALPEAVGGLTGLQMLDLLGCSGLKKLPAGIRRLTGLQTLNLEECSGLEALPEAVGGLTGLQTLNLRGCRGLKALPEAVGGRTGLQTLDLRGCSGLKALPEAVGGLTGLQTLNLRGCSGLKALPEAVGGLTGLQTLDLGCSGLKELPAGMEVLTGLQTLNLGWCTGLEKLPAGIGGLTGLQTLNLGGCEELRELPAGIEGLKGLQTLDLGGCRRLEELPAGIGSLTRLQTLNLGRCKGLREMPAGIGGLTGLLTLNLGGCSRLEELPEGIGELTGLQTLDLDGCSELRELPAGIGGLMGLQTLNLERCSGLRELPFEIGKLSGLQSLNVRGCHSLPPSILEVDTEAIKDFLRRAACGSLQDVRLAKNILEVPTWVSQQTALQTLNLKGCSELRELPAGIGRLTGLQTLNLEGCSGLEELPDLPVMIQTPFFQRRGSLELKLGSFPNLHVLPEWLAQLTWLKTLNLQDCKSLRALPACVGVLTGLESLNLRDCSELKQLPEEVGDMAGLQELNLFRCSSLISLPNSIGRLTGLQTLNLGSCKGMKYLPSIGGLTSLRVLNLTECEELLQLNHSIGELTLLKSLDLRGCHKLHTPPRHIVQAGTPAVMQFLRDLGKGDAPCYLVKVVLVGDQRAGKSSLADSLVQGKPVRRAYDDRTVGIDVRRWRLGLESQVVANVYDAAGQVVYRATHGLFMSEGALFLHVVRSDMAEDAAVEALLEWMEAVQQEAPGAVMGVVWTHIDCMHDEDQANALQTRVLRRVRTEIERQVEAVDSALQEMEDDILQACSESADNSMQPGELAQWKQIRECRDAALKTLDQHAIIQQASYNVPKSRQTNSDRSKQRATRASKRKRGEERKNMGEVQSESSEKKQFLDEEEMLADELEAGAERRDWEEGSTIASMADALKALKSQHDELKTLEASTTERLGRHFQEKLDRLRLQRAQRPRVVCSLGVSCLSGQGLEEVRQALTALMEDDRLFPQVGARVPLNYSMLERLAQAGRNQTIEDADDGEDAAERDGADEVERRAEWEEAVTEHVKKNACPALRTVCRKPYASLDELEKAAEQVGMDRDQVRSALRFLHGTGAMLHYGEDTRRGNQELSKVVFNQPDFIIDAIKFVIREPKADDVNDLLRKMDARIRRSHTDGEALDRFLGGDDRNGSGVLNRRLLTRHLWRDFNPADHQVLLQLMKAFKLLRLLTEADPDTFLVPAMLPRSGLPQEYMDPHWSRPSKSSAAACMMIGGAASRAQINVEYKVVAGGRLPFGFMNELQVVLAQARAAAEDQDREAHFVPEAAVVERHSGSVLSAAYRCGAGQTREWVIMSRGRSTTSPGGEGPAPSGATATSESVRVMAWAELFSDEGATDWRLLRRVLREIEAMEREALVLCFKKIVTYVDRSGRQSKPLVMTPSLSGRQVLPFEFGDGREVVVDREHVLPSGCDVELSQAEESVVQVSNVSEEAPASEEGPNHIEAFFAKRSDDGKIDVHREGQAMMRIIKNAGSASWDCSVNPQPTLDDLYLSIRQAKQRKMRSLHLGGHSRKKCGFVWNADDSAKKSREFDLEAICALIGSVAGEQGPLEHALLNACSTHEMGRLLREMGVPFVVCWLTSVQDETAREFCELFYSELVKDGSGARDYRRAFFAAADAMRLLAHTRGAAQPPRVADDVVGSAAGTRSSNTRNASPDSEDMLLEGGGGACEAGSGKSSVRGRVQPWHIEDVVQLLSVDGDSGPIYLWRDRTSSTPQPAAPQASEQAGTPEVAVDPALQAAFEQRGLGFLCVSLCSFWGVEAVDDLREFGAEDVDDLPKYIKDQLKPLHRKRLLAMVGGALSEQGLAETRPADGGLRSSETPGRRPRVFLGYRVSTDAGLVERLHDKLKAEGIDVWWDKKCLLPGQRWEEGFADGLCGSDVFVPVLSKEALAPCAQLAPSSRCDNVVLEHQLALELKHRGDLRAICPVLVGEVEQHPHLGDIYGDFFAGGGKPSCRDEVVVEVEGKLAEHLARLNKGSPQLPAASRTIKATLDAILQHQGERVRGTDALEAVAAAIVRHCRSTWR